MFFNACLARVEDLLQEKNYKSINYLWHDPEIQDNLVGEDINYIKKM